MGCVAQRRGYGPSRGWATACCAREGREGARRHKLDGTPSQEVRGGGLVRMTFKERTIRIGPAYLVVA